MSDTVFHCPSCGAKFSIRPDMAGQRGRCPRCKTSFQVPGAPPVAADPAPSPSSAPLQNPFPPTPSAFGVVATSDTTRTSGNSATNGPSGAVEPWFYTALGIVAGFSLLLVVVVTYFLFKYVSWIELDKTDNVDGLLIQFRRLWIFACGFLFAIALISAAGLYALIDIARNVRKKAGDTRN